MAMRSTEIDLDVHKAIEAARRSFDETDNEVLRRMLGLATAALTVIGSPKPQGRAWSSKGVVLAHGTDLRMEYRGIEHHGRIEDGAWVCGGRRHAGPSPAAAAVATTRSGSVPSLNGWVYWQAKVPGTSAWVPISTMRKGN